MAWMEAEDWLMVASTTSGQWVPVASTGWSWDVQYYYLQRSVQQLLNKAIMAASSHTPVTKTMFQPTLAFPVWQKVLNTTYEPM